MASLAALVAAGKRRAKAAAKNEVRIEWFVNKVLNEINTPLRKRVIIATKLVQVKVIKNISRPVTKTRGPRTGRIVVTNRSTFGEFPKADTAQLMKTIFSGVRGGISKGVIKGFVATPLDYGLLLEVGKTKQGVPFNRKFLSKTLEQNRPLIIRLLTRPIK